MQQDDGTTRKLVLAVRKLSAGEPDEKSETVRIVDGSTILVKDQPRRVTATRLKLPTSTNPCARYTFDHAFDATVRTEQIYERCVSSIVRQALNGDRSICLVYRSRLPAQQPGMSDAMNSIVEFARKAARQMMVAQTNKASGEVSLKVSWTEFDSLDSDCLFDVLNDRKVIRLQREPNDIMKTVSSTEKQLNSVNQIEELFEEGLLTAQSPRYALMELALQFDGTVYSRISFWQLPLPEQSKASKRANTEPEKLFLLGKAARNMNQGRVRLSKSDKLSQLLRSNFKSYTSILALVNIEASPNFLKQTLAALQAASQQRVNQQPNKTRKTSGQSRPSEPVPALRTADILIEESVDEPKTKNEAKQSAQSTGYSKSLKQSMRPTTLRTYHAKAPHRSVKLDWQNPAVKDTNRSRNRTAYEVPLRTNNIYRKSHQPNSRAKILRTEEECYIKAADEANNASVEQLHYCRTQENVAEEPQTYYTARQHQGSHEDLDQSIEKLLPFDSELCESIYKTTIEPVLQEDLLIPSTLSSQFEWAKLVRQFNQWEPSMRKGCEFFTQAEEYLAGRLREEMDALGWVHSEYVSKEVETIKGEVQLVNRLKENRGDCDPLVYMDTIELAIEIKLEGMLKLKQQAKTLRQHINELQSCQDKLEMAKLGTTDRCGFEDLLEDESLL